MTNADKFKGIFGIFATELWSKTEKEFLEWLNADVTDTNIGDTISRSDAIDAIHKAVLEMFDFCDDNIEEPLTYTEEKMLEVNKLIVGKIKDLPSAQQKGKWIKVKPISGDLEAYMCPFCKTGDWDISVDSYNYCPYCGKPVSGVADDPSHPFEDDVMAKGWENED